ncbi:MAG: hypothetical protein Q4F21_09165, partial [Lachnospiraceae bacterium]|nr:hypothetical protein [Lachnospiraceae bacterium]
MFFRLVFAQVGIILQKRNAMIAVTLVWTFALINFISNVFAYSGRDVISMYEPVKILLLADDSGPSGFYFMQLYPIFVALPAAFSFAEDRDSNEIVFMVSKTGVKYYFRSKMIAIFLASFFVFLLPLLMEYVLTLLSFPLNAIADNSNVDMYQEVYIEGVRRYLWCDLYIKAPFIYGLFGIVWFAFVSGILNVFAAAISTFKVRFKIMLLLPSYFLLYGFMLIGTAFRGISFSTWYSAYLRTCTLEKKSALGVLIALLGVILLSIIIIERQARKDW